MTGNTIELLDARAAVELDAYEHRLFCYYRNCGGTCCDSADYIARSTRMSAGKVSKARRALMEKGFINLAPGYRNGYCVELAVSEPSTSEGTTVSLHTVKDEPSPREGWDANLHHMKDEPSPHEGSGNARAHTCEEESFIPIPIEIPPAPKDAGAGAGAREAVFGLYEKAFGRLVPSEFVAEELRDLAADYPDDWLEDAFRETSINHASSLNYVRKVLERWQREGRHKAKPTTAAPHFMDQLTVIYQ